MITAIIPTYRNPEYLELCLASATELKRFPETEIICIVDGYVEESQKVIDKFPDVSYIPLDKNYGMQYAINVGVMNAKHDWIYVVNDDNVFGSYWDSGIFRGMQEVCEEYGIVDSQQDTVVLTVNQVEPDPSIFNFHCKDFGRTPKEFDYFGWSEYEVSISEYGITDQGLIFPFAMSKRWFMTVGGFDTFYKSPFWCDVDFWLKLELLDHLEFARWHGNHMYHFGSAATKNRGDEEAQRFKDSEMEAANLFYYKWGYLPDLVHNAQNRHNTKLPENLDDLRGISSLFR